MLMTACEPVNDGTENDNGNSDQTEQTGGGNTDKPDEPDEPENPADPENPETQIIKFQDENTKLICILHWDEDEDGELSYEEAAAVTNLGTAFKDSRILSFTELKHFTSLTNIANDEFEGCASLVKISLPEQITTIDENAFSGCTNLQKIVIPDSVTSIGKYAFNGCSGLTSVNVGNSVTSIGKYAFYGCTGELIVNCNIPSCSYSDDGAFCDSEFTKATIGDGVTTIGKWAFYSCSSLTSVTIPDSVTSIEDCAIHSCGSLTSITIPDSVTSIEDCAFYGCSRLASITIPDSVTKIGQDAFHCCKSLTAFYGKFASADNRCLIIDGELNSFAPAGLTEYAIPDSVTVISGEVFAWFDCLTSVTIPNSVTEIGGGAFYDCTSLTSVYCKSTTPPTATGYDIFSTYDYDDGAKPIGCTIYVPTASVEAYKAAKVWSDYAKYIKGYDFDNGVIDQNVDIIVTVGSVVDITGKPDYEKDYPSDSTMCIYIVANGNELKSIKLYISTNMPADTNPEDVLALKDAWDMSEKYIPDMIESGYTLSVITGLTPGTTYDIFLGFTTIYGKTQYYRIQYTPESAKQMMN